MVLIYSIIAITLLIATWISFQKYNKSNLAEDIKELQNIKNSLDIDIAERNALLKDIDNTLDINKLNELDNKLNYLIKNQDKSDPNNTAIILLFFIISTGLTLYFIEKKTYYIQPQNQIGMFNQLLKQLGF